MSKYNVNDVKATPRGFHRYNQKQKDEWLAAYREYQDNFYRDFDPTDLRPAINIPISKPARTEAYYAAKGIAIEYEKYEGVPDDDIVEYQTKRESGVEGPTVLMSAKQARKKGRERAMKIAYQREIGHNRAKRVLGASVGHRLACDMSTARRIGRIMAIPHTQVNKRLADKIDRRYDEMAKADKSLPREKSSPVINKVFQDDGALMVNMQEMVKNGMKNQGKLMSYPTADDLQMECQKFLLYCEERQVAPTVPMLNVWLGISSAQHKKYLALGNDHSRVLEFMNEYMHAFTLDKAMNGHVHHVLYVYLSKNWWDMSDKVEQTVTTVHTGLDGADKDIVMASIQNLPVIDIDADEDDDWDE